MRFVLLNNGEVVSGPAEFAKDGSLRFPDLAPGGFTHLRAYAGPDTSKAIDLPIATQEETAVRDKESIQPDEGPLGAVDLGHPPEMLDLGDGVLSTEDPEPFTVFFSTEFPHRLFTPEQMHTDQGQPWRILGADPTHISYESPLCTVPDGQGNILVTYVAMAKISADRIEALDAYLEGK